MLCWQHILESNPAEMAAKHLLEIERAIHQLSAKEKLWLLELIARHLQEPDETELLEMASAPEIQVEMVAIDREFALTEMDGLQSA